MMKHLQKLYATLSADRVVMLWLGVWWVCNLVQATFTELAHDEAYYQMFSENMAWGYFDHPPMTALLVWLGQHLFGGELGVRFFFVLLQPLYLVILWHIIRPSDADRRDGTLFCMLSAATLMLQLYGFIAVPDSPLMMTSALFLLFFKWFSEKRPWAWLWMGLAMAAMAYSKYHGALVVLFALAANPRLLLRPQLYLSGIVAFGLFVPHLLWQYHHDWASFAYHLSDRNAEFRPGYLVEYVLNLLVVFNPLYVPIYVLAWCKTHPATAVERVLKLLPAAFILFFLISTLRGAVQPQWIIVATFGLLYVLFTYARRHPRTRRYLMRAGWITVILLALTRIEMMCNPLGIRFEIFNNHESFEQIAEIAQGRPVIFRNSYAVASKYRFYTDGKAYCQPNIYYRTHQWQYRDDDTQFVGSGPILIECHPNMTDTTRLIRTVTLPNGYRFTYFEEPQFHPVRRVEIRGFELPAEVTDGDLLRFDLQFDNTYPYDIDIDNRETSLVILWQQGRQVNEYDTGLTLLLPACNITEASVEFETPSGLKQGDCSVGFALAKRGYTFWFNGKPLRTEVVTL